MEQKSDIVLVDGDRWEEILVRQRKIHDGRDWRPRHCFDRNDA